MKLSPRTITIEPATIFIVLETPPRIAKVEVKRIPRAIKTIENPITKKTVLKNAPRRISRLSIISPNVVPPINERYAGINGSTHGERNERTPAANEIPIESDVSN